MTTGFVVPASLAGVRVDEAVTDELYLPGPDRPGPGGRFARGLAGSLAAGLVVLALVLGVGELLASANAVQGPGTGVLIGHAVAALLAVGAAVVADRTRGAVAAAAVATVLVTTAVVLWVFWLT